MGSWRCLLLAGAWQLSVTGCAVSNLALPSIAETGSQPGLGGPCKEACGAGLIMLHLAGGCLGTQTHCSGGEVHYPSQPLLYLEEINGPARSQRAHWREAP